MNKQYEAWSDQAWEYILLLKRRGHFRASLDLKMALKVLDELMEEATVEQVTEDVLFYVEQE
ncbi:hypothetical protein [Corynebacterium sp. HMSC28B08]|uniref:hypothetical protein n=1 Tax=Corynebacterium sp. HMSC28B08 TaxID=1581066 RepID=UPI0008A2B5D5|nr:hypothetical protein [Corynebacterium sp. HMSC28B08]OFT89001.1 hypothetical protein HMPREF3098_06810 [Corynebacterium sp. HMSC28B08]